MTYTTSRAAPWTQAKTTSRPNATRVKTDAPAEVDEVKVNT